MAKYKVVSSIVDLASGKLLSPGSFLEIDDKEKDRIKVAEVHVKNGILEPVEEPKTEEEPEEKSKTKSKKGK